MTSYFLTRNCVCDWLSQNIPYTFDCSLHSFLAFIAFLRLSWVKRAVKMHDKMAAKRDSRQCNACQSK
jgi:hypothetical protein